jgi:type I restriction enzyme S subunit
MSMPTLRFKEFSDNWIAHSLEDLADVTTGDKDTQDKNDGGLYPFFVRSQTIEKINSYSYEGEAVLTSGDGVGVGKNFHYVNGKFNYHQRVYCISNFNKNVIARYIYYYFSAKFYRRVMALSAKTSVDSVRRNMITEMQIYLPSYLEQTKISNFLTAIDEKITQLTQKHSLLNLYKKGMMQKIFSQELRFKDSDGDKFSDWEYKSISTIFLRRSHASKTEFIDEGGRYFIVDMGSIGRDASLISTKTTNYADDFLTTNDLVMAKDDIGGGNIIGKVIKIPEDNKYICGDHVYKLSLRENLGCIGYYYFAINSYEVNKSFRKKANGTAQIGISINTVDEQSIPVPCIKEQIKIHNFLASIDKKISATQSELELFKQYKQGLVQQMFV